MKQINKGFKIGSAISVIGFVVLGWFYLRFTADNVAASVLADIHALPACATSAS